MKRFRRWLFRGVAALSLLLCVATAALWVRSIFRFDNEGFQWGDTTTVAPSYHFWSATSGGILVVKWRAGQLLRVPSKQVAYHFASRPHWLPTEFSDYSTCWFDQKFARWQRMGFGYVHVTNSFDGIIGFMVPLWALCAIFAAGPIAMALVHLKVARTRKRARSGQCAICGYDLRCTPDRCPECGKVPPKLEIAN